ncbi:adenylate/guanylate cyclase domain-containing protein [Chelatococcus reniformis]|uniref:Adenylate cyclase n=1 Tax=Chelatococcus reniformis TaxID=1494448 RepID=A0A916XLW0_9HYPH|nr:adenylate/guanylate cyclase domain-containing protein [Chelatococcus reniformis]GGC81367.1 adenylate cyclase [Chelatococcus reniformis]
MKLADTSGPPPSVGSKAEDGSAICSVTSSSFQLASELWPVLGEDGVKSSVAIRDWLLVEARQTRDPNLILSGLSERLNGAGIPVDRASLVIETLHAQHAAVGRVWIKGQATVEAEEFAYVRDASDNYMRSPFYAVHQTRAPLALRLDEIPDDLYSIVPSLKASGYVHYLCFPMFFANGDENGISFATRDDTGFTEAHIAFLKLLMPAIAAVVEIVAGYLSLDSLLRIYIGDEPHKLVLNGDVRRGQVSRIRSAILFADMRGYTHLSSGISPEETVDLLNAYFDCLVPPIEQEGGEVLKYLGDGLLAIFRDRGDDTGGAARAALDAARQSLELLDALNQGGSLPVRIEAGIALHHGDAAYGNVGSGARLDFTVVGRDVNLTSRLAGLNKVLSEPLIMSEAFTNHLWGDPILLGRFALDGITDEIAVYKP